MSEITTISMTQEAAPGLLLNEIDSRIVRIRPSATPLDQISRLGGSRTAGAMKVEYYSVDTRPLTVEVEDHPTTGIGHQPSEITLADSSASLLEPTETFMIPDTFDDDGNPIVFYVVSHEKGSTKVKVAQINHGKAGSVNLAGRTVVRMGRAASELDVQTPQFAALPRKEWNLCQIFKTQIEESTLHRLTNKEVGWTFSDQEEVAVIDMRLGMEKSFLFGSRYTLPDPEKGEDVMLTGGIWHQTKHQFSYSGSDDPDSLALDLVREAFKDHSGSRRKILLAGSELIDILNRQKLNRTASATAAVTKWGIDFTEIVSKFGRLYVTHAEIFDQCGMAGGGMVIDPDYITKYCFIPMQAERLELKRSGQRNTDAIVITEASCLVLRHPAAHMRIVLD
ncbi:MAG: DUF5309 domain-containing protein [Bacteroides sp.]|nr:DUF5309 domain-containing protein [Bacteroides sp.]